MERDQTSEQTGDGPGEQTSDQTSEHATDETPAEQTAEMPRVPAGLPYTGKTSQHGHPWEQADQSPPLQPAQIVEPVSSVEPVQPAQPVEPVDPAQPPGVALLSAPPGQHGSLAGSSWEQRAQQPVPFSRLVDGELRKLVATTAERVMLGVAGVLLLAVTWLAATLVNRGGPTDPAYQLFGLVLACQLGPVALYAVVLRSLSAEWYYRSIELTQVYLPDKSRIRLAQLILLLPLWLVVALLQFGIYFLAKPSLPPVWALGVALLGGLLSLLFPLAIALLVRNPNAAVLVYLVLSVGYVVRVRNPLFLRWVDPWQPASKLAGSVPELPPSLTSAALLIAVVALGCVVAARR